MDPSPCTLPSGPNPSYRAGVDGIRPWPLVRDPYAKDGVGVGPCCPNGERWKFIGVGEGGSR